MCNPEAARLRYKCKAMFNLTSSRAERLLSSLSSRQHTPKARHTLLPVLCQSPDGHSCTSQTCAFTQAKDVSLESSDITYM